MEKLEFDFEKIDDPANVRCIKEYKFKPYYYVADVLHSEKIFTHFIKDIKKKQTGRDHYFLVARKGEYILGVCVLRISEWDSKLFGFNYGTIKYMIADERSPASLDIKNRMIRFLLEWCEEKKIRFLHSRVDRADASSVHALEGNGFKFVAEVVRYINFSERIKLLRKVSLNVDLFREDDMEKIRKIAGFVFQDNRFFLDRNFNRKKVQELYESWMVNSCVGEIQDKVFVYRYEKTIAGFATCGLRRYDSEGLSKRIGAIDLVGVDPVHQNRGVAVKMVQSVMSWLKANTDLCEAVMAVRNSPMIRILEKYGFTPRCTQMDFHWWMK